MIKKAIYRFLRFGAKLNLLTYFGKIEFNGTEHIPKGKQPIIFSPNHQGAFMDAVILGVFAPMPVYYLTRSDVFKPSTKWFLDALNMMPIYRIRDGRKALSKNDVVFETCNQILKDKKALMIFPEANHRETHYLRPITKGISRISLNAQMQNDSDVLVIPVGINYFHHTRSGRKLILNYGSAINVKEYLSGKDEVTPRDLNQFKIKVQDAMKEVLVIPENDERYENRRLAFNREYQKNNFESLREIANSDKEFTSEKAYPLARLLANALLIFNLPLFLLYFWVEKNKISQVAFISSIKIALGLLIFPFWLMISFLIVGLIFSWKAGLIVMLLQIGSILIRRQIVAYGYSNK